jgi:competence protein ComEA
MLESPRSTIAIWVVAAVLAVLAGVRLFGGGDPGPAPVSIDGAGGGAEHPAGGSRTQRPAAGGSKAELYVHVAGAVRRPGLMRVPAGARVATALDRAGGPTSRADLTMVNLAARLQDGQQIVVPVRGATGRGSGMPAAPPGMKLHLSTATVEQLDEIDGIGPTLAERIIEYRDEHGGFRSLDELSQVDGIGEKRMASLREQLQP